MKTELRAEPCEGGALRGGAFAGRAGHAQLADITSRTGTCLHQHSFLDLLGVIMMTATVARAGRFTLQGS